MWYGMKLILIFFLLIQKCFCQHELSDKLNQRWSLITNPINIDDTSIENTFPFIQQSCAKDALEKFMPICLKDGAEAITSELRVETAVKLSLCEFKASGIESIPIECKNATPDTMLSCLIQLESYPQWWTTYSGNFQRLTSVCYENSLPYEKEQILNLFLNVTDMYSDINVSLEKYIKDTLSSVESDTSKFMSEFSERLYNLQDLMDDIMNEIHNNNISDKVKEAQEENLKQWEVVEKQASDSMDIYLQYQNEMFLDMHRFFDELKVNIKVLSNEITIAAVENSLETWNGLVSNSFENITDRINKTIVNLDVIENKISRLNYSMNVIVRIFESTIYLLKTAPMLLMTRYSWLSTSVAILILKYFFKLNTGFTRNFIKGPIFINWFSVVTAITLGRIVGTILVKKYNSS
ncbi:hypothetical protein Kpol_1019p10 [Vanderwaltozyma polyspora DSM 70294]|uniref:Nuclear fusion protein KAR5 n=1 Tax=Vanderwaltozyma polyspora (strain ATCC 22028 / DSM 70294 / BCRC 21397 / CBS 2163 / NBRC 10782 / NRRL Y-8283 / UCD 57-17) TaxID=436907 RepID=A7TPA3_VANPO|nr:uncharacterized protein Kpol_1019p10 [Vanderwaltozyma polyspora DSM 70294]EDO15890.1 hypothetical protein Kpol_1019p10 [Vanderwaltozyma polyspora DSM 70294]